jgi:hypothetical protein
MISTLAWGIAVESQHYMALANRARTWNYQSDQKFPFRVTQNTNTQLNKHILWSFFIDTITDKWKHKR